MTTDEKFKLITRNLEEVLTEEELKHLIDSGTPLKHYIGFEISGKLHIGYLFQMMKIKDMLDAEADVIIWLADLHSAINDKLDGNLETIKRMSREYFAPAMEALCACLGISADKLNFKLCSEEYAEHPEFWQIFLEVGKNTTISRTKRSITIMGREDQDDSAETAKLMYPIMQAADVFLLQRNIIHAGIDQRKVHVIAIDVANKIKTSPLKDISGNIIKPIAIHTPILLGLTPPDTSGQNLDADELAMRSKMSKSRVGSGITIHDEPDVIRDTINQAYAPEGVVEGNPLLNWCKYLVFYDQGSTLSISRPEKWGGEITYNSYEDLERDYAEKKLHPQDLKAAVAEWLITKLEPARKYFEDPKRKAALEEIESLTSKKS